MTEPVLVHLCRACVYAFCVCMFVRKGRRPAWAWAQMLAWVWRVGIGSQARTGVLAWLGCGCGLSRF
eukprot:469676-Pleurochrysis_carterae.AAC.6